MGMRPMGIRMGLRRGSMAAGSRSISAARRSPSPPRPMRRPAPTVARSWSATAPATSASIAGAPAAAADSEPPARVTRSLRAISLFSGAGGADLGFERAGFEIVGSIEIDRDARETLALNRPGWTVASPGDVDHWADPHVEVPKAWCVPDVLVAGPPCQPFSKASQWRTPVRGLDDPRGSTIRSLLRLI